MNYNLRNRKYMFTKHSIIAVFLSIASAAFGELEWQQKLIDIKAVPADAEASAKFEFRNIGDNPVTITSVKSSCGCTTVGLEKKTYAPGEKGEIMAKFQFGERVGQQEKIIAVSSDDAKEPHLMLTFRVLIPELVKIEPAVVTWKVGEEKTPKSAKIHILEEGEVKLQKASSLDAKMQVDLKEIVPGKEYEIKVSPEDTAQPLISAIRLEGKIAEGKPKTFQMHGQVQSEGKGYGARL